MKSYARCRPVGESSPVGSAQRKIRDFRRKRTLQGVRGLANTLRAAAKVPDVLRGARASLGRIQTVCPRNSAVATAELPPLLLLIQSSRMGQPR